MLHFDEKELSRQIERLSKEHRIAFAAACAQRLIPSYERFSKKTGKGNYPLLVNTIEDLWKDLTNGQAVEKDIDERISTCMGLIPGEDDEPWISEQACAEDAASALAYALRCLRTGEPQEAAWAARRAYECLDHYVINSEKIDTNVSGAEVRVLSHPLIQTELSRQQRDLNQLVNRSVTVEQLKARAQFESSSFLP